MENRNRRNKKSKKINIYKVVVFSLATLLLISVINLIPNKEEQLAKEIQENEIEQIQEHQEATVAREIADVKLKDDIVNADKVIEKVSDQVELILYEESGTLEFQYDKQKDEWYNELNDSKIKIKLDYKTILVMPTDKIIFKNKLGIVSVKYEVSDIYCKMVEFSEPIVIVDRGLFGKRYTETELLSIVDIEKCKLKEQINNNSELKTNAETNLIQYISSLCYSFDTEFNLDNSDGYNLVEFEEIQYNHPNKYRDSTEYLIIHTTNNYKESATAQSHYDYWNSDPNANVSSNYVVDGSEVIQCVDINKISWSVSKNKWKDDQVVFNENSISIEMCNNVDFEKTLGNTVELIRNQILPQYPNIIITNHREASGKESCPDMDEATWEKFLEKIYE